LRTDPPIDQFSAALADLRELSSRSITARQPGLTLAFCLCMQAVILAMSGISLAQSRIASPLHICCASEVKAKPGDVDRQLNAAASARVIVN
jgi:hypothetical protein